MHTEEPSGQLTAQQAMGRHRVDTIQQLPLDLVLLVLHLLPPNEVSCTARLLCKQAAQRLSSPEHRTVRLSQPLPAHAAAWWQRWQEGVRQRSFLGKLRVLSTAAASGCETNCVVAWRLVEPGVLPELLPGFYADQLCDLRYDLSLDPGSAAVRSGHLHLLPWMVVHGWPVHAEETLKAVAQRCDLPTLQWAWRLLLGEAHEGATGVLGGALASTTPDTPSKIEWLRRQKCTVQYYEIDCAAMASDELVLEQLRWCMQHAKLGLYQRGSLLEVALAHASLGAVQQLHRESGVSTLTRRMVCAAAGSEVECVEKLLWLREGEHGMGWEQGWLDSDDEDDGMTDKSYMWGQALAAAIAAGNTEAVPVLVEEFDAEVPQTLESADEAELEEFAHRKRPDRVAVLAYLERMDVPVPPSFMSRVAISSGDVETLQWLLAPERDEPLGHLSEWGRGPLAWPELNRGCPAAEAACLRMLQLLAPHARGVLTTDRVLRHMALLGSLAIVRWLVEACGCAVGHEVLQGAVDSGNGALVAYLVARGAPTDGLSIMNAATRGDLATLRLLLAGPYSMRVVEGTLTSIVQVHSWRNPGQPLLPLVQWLVRQGLPLRVGEVEGLVTGDTPCDEATRFWLARQLGVLKLGAERTA